MKNLLFLFLIAVPFFSQGQIVYLNGSNQCMTSDWKLVFYDEFSSSSINTNKWYTYFPTWPNNTDQSEFSRTHGDEGQIYRDQNVVSQFGKVKLRALKQSGTWYSAQRDYTSGWIQTHINNFEHGKFEIRCKIPSGEGFWPAFWLYAGNGEEIDIFEFGAQNPNKVHTNVWESNGTQHPQSYNGSNYSSGFHTFKCEWGNMFVKFYVDNTLIRTVSRYIVGGAPVLTCSPSAGYYSTNPQFPITPMSLIANLAVGTSTTPFTNSPPTNTVFPKDLEIDYIRVYQRDVQSSLTDLCDKGTISGPNTVCNSSNTTYNLSSSSSNFSYWQVSSNLQIISSNSNSITVKPKLTSSSGDGWIRAHYSSLPSLCSSTYSSKNVTVGKSSVSSISQISMSCQSAEFKANVSNNSYSNNTYNWTIQAGATNIGSTNQQYNLVDPDNSASAVILSVTTDNGCGASTATNGYFNINCWGQKVAPEVEVIVYPNPADNLLNYSISNLKDNEKLSNISIWNSKRRVKLLKKDISDSVDISDLKPGLYYIIVKYLNEERKIITMSEEFIKQ